MDGIIFACILVVVILVIVAAAKSGVGGYDQLAKTGTPARGILLQVSSTGTRVAGSGLRRFERRTVLIDIEVPGSAPYEASVDALVPSNLVRDVLPGATVELRVDPKDPNRIAIVGPGAGFVGFSALGTVPEQRAS